MLIITIIIIIIIVNITAPRAVKDEPKIKTGINKLTDQKRESANLYCGCRRMINDDTAVLLFGQSEWSGSGLTFTEFLRYYLYLHQGPKRPQLCIISCEGPFLSKEFVFLIETFALRTKNMETMKTAFPNVGNVTEGNNQELLDAPRLRKRDGPIRIFRAKTLFDDSGPGTNKNSQSELSTGSSVFY